MAVPFSQGIGTSGQGHKKLYPIAFVYTSGDQY